MVIAKAGLIGKNLLSLAIYKQRTEKLITSMIEELKNLSRNCCDNCYAFDYFLEVKRNVLLEREKIKLAVVYS